MHWALKAKAMFSFEQWKLWNVFTNIPKHYKENASPCYIPDLSSIISKISNIQIFRQATNSYSGKLDLKTHPNINSQEKADVKKIIRVIEISPGIYAYFL